MLSINLYEFILQEYLNFEKYLSSHANSTNEYDKKIYKVIMNWHINKNELTKYTIYRTLFDLLKEKYGLENVTDQSFLIRMGIRRGKQNTIFDDIDYRKYSDLILYTVYFDEKNLENIEEIVSEQVVLEDYCLDYFCYPKFVNAIIEEDLDFEYKVKKHPDILTNILEYAQDSVRNNPDFFYALKSPHMSSLISEDLRNNPEFILNILSNRYTYASDFTLIGDKLKSDRDFMLKLCEQHSKYLIEFDKRFGDGEDNKKNDHC